MADVPESWERWQFADFDASSSPAASAKSSNAPATREIDAATLAQIEQLREAAREQGYAAGQEAGHAAGYAQGQAQARNEVLRLAGLLAQFNEALAGLDQQMAESMLALSLEVARQVLRQSLRIQPELILETLRQALAQLHTPQATLTLHPEDALLVRACLAETEADPRNGTRILEDARISRGGCLVEAAGSQIDATLETRWRRTLESLGQTGEWLVDAAPSLPDVFPGEDAQGEDDASPPVS